VLKSQHEFELIAMPEAPRLLRFARRLTGDTSAAEDLAQETLLKAWRNFDQLQRGTSARAWMFQILVNTFYGQGRKIRASPVMVPLEVQIPTGANSRTIERLEMEQALGALEVDHRAVLLLGVVEGFTCREIGRILSIPVGTVMSRLSRAREALREKVAPERGVAAAARGQEDGR
jgi:RNA polymerase sigma-70 factor (ECF subfamily)